MKRLSKTNICIGGGHLDKRAFTLIELLAVIVILAIIALIATPVILGIINDAKKEATKRSAENYVKAVEQAVMRENLTAHFAPTTCQVAGTTLSCTGYEPIQVDVEGEKPISGTITFANNRVDTYSLTYTGDKTVTKESSTYEIASPICTLEGTAQDPNKYSAGDKYICTVAPGKDYAFYVLNDTEKTAESVNLILEANIDASGNPIKTNDAPILFVAWQTSGNKADGPTTAMNALKTATDSWTNLTDMKISGWNRDTCKTNVGTFATPYIVKARLPYISEVDATGCNHNNSTCPLWMVNYLIDYYNPYTGRTEISGNSGYWTLSSICYHETDGAWFVNHYGNTNNGPIEYGYLGLRPVITVLKSNISQ